ncbi:basic salivary proline-rich protein 1-like [Phalacrocorax carbo]|uniref:basic salivary proline-rich protein 1-like n=1 Tax=Phalacrocorax carbo TaxID=9209 RepID=UPI00311A4928
MAWDMPLKVGPSQGVPTIRKQPRRSGLENRGAAPAAPRPLRGGRRGPAASPEPPPFGGTGGEGLQVPSRSVQGKTSAEQRSPPGLPQHPPPSSSSSSSSSPGCSPRKTQGETVAPPAPRRAEPCRAARPLPPRPRSRRPRGPRRGGERGRGPGRGGRGGEGRAALPTWSCGTPPPPAPPRSRHRGAAPSGEGKEDGGGAGSGASPPRPRASPGPRPSAPRDRRCPGGAASAPGVPAPPPGVPLMAGRPRSVLPRSPAPRPGDPAPWPRGFPLFSRRVPALCLGFQHRTRGVSHRARSVPLGVRGLSRTHPGPVPAARVGTLLRRSLPQPPTRQQRAAPLSHGPEQGAGRGAARRGGGRCQAGPSGPGGTRAPPAPGLRQRRGSPRTGLLGFYLRAFVQRRRQVPRR